MVLIRRVWKKNSDPQQLLVTIPLSNGEIVEGDYVRIIKVEINFESG